MNIFSVSVYSHAKEEHQIEVEVIEGIHVTILKLRLILDVITSWKKNALHKRLYIAEERESQSSIKEQ